MKPIDEMNAEELRVEIEKLVSGCEISVGSPLLQVTASGAIHVFRDYANSISDAWELLEKAMAEPYEQFVVVRKTPATSNFWYCEIGCVIAKGDTAPLAICRAWLKWKESVN
jgi:hypothetical protein